MATGSRLVRLMLSKYWLQNIQAHTLFRSAILYDKKGVPAPAFIIMGERMCHLRIVFKQLPDDHARKLAKYLATTASGIAEHMNGEVFHFYGFTEIVIS